MNILEIKNLTKRFAGLIAVNDLSFEMPKRSVHALIGPSDSGKTITINIVDEVFPPTEGQIFFQGMEITDKSTHETSRLGLRHTFQNIKLFSALTAEENLMTGGHMAYAKAGIASFFFDIGRANREEKTLKKTAEEILESMRLKDIAKRQVGGFSYGMLKMVELAHTMMTKLKLILLNESTAGLNPSEYRDLIEILMHIFDNGIDLFLTEHNMGMVMDISHKVTVINFGSKTIEGKSVDIQNNPEVIRAYLGGEYQ